MSLEIRKRRKYIWAAYRYSFSRLVLNYYLYYESMWDAADIPAERTREGEEFEELLESFLKGKNAMKDLDRLRTKVIGRIQALTGFSDCFQVYEYVLNRMERRFIPMEDSRYTPEELGEALIEAIAALKHPADQNEKIRSIVGQLPIRFTRQKFYAMVSEKLSLYAGLKKSDVENFLGMLKASAMVRLPDHMEEEKELYRYLSVLRDEGYQNMDLDGFRRCVNALSAATAALNHTVDCLTMLADLINDLYVLFLTEREAMADVTEDQYFRNGVSRILQAVRTRDKGLSEDEGDQILTRMEGIQESVEDLVMAGSPGEDETLKKLAKLLSASSFMDLEDKEDSFELTDKAWMEKKAREFCQELDEMFGGMEKAVVRGVMAKVLSELPVMFQDGMEVQRYIISSLESCSDHGERQASMELLEQELMD